MKRSLLLRTYLIRCGIGCLLLAHISNMASAQPPAADPSTSHPSTKPKKVITNDDLAPDPAPGNVPTEKRSASTARPTKDPNAQLARSLRSKLEKLNAQVKDADLQIDKLKRFQAGETDGTSRRDLHKGYNRTPIGEQISKLEENRRQWQRQISAIYDEARHKGIAPGELR